MAHLERNGIRIRYDRTGDGPVVLLSHGYTASRHMWAPNVGAIADAGHTVVTWDQRGHGDSDYPADPAAYAEEEAVADMAAILDAVGADRAVIAGMSLGGYLSLAFHLAHPERTAALVLVDTGPGFKSDEARAGWNRSAEQYAADFAERGLDALPVSPERSEVDRSVHRDASGLVGAARGLMVQRDARAIASLPTWRCRRWWWWATRTRRSSRRPTTWRPRCPTPARSSSSVPATPPTSTSRRRSTRRSPSSWRVCAPSGGAQRRPSSTAATLTMGTAGGRSPREPAKGLSEKLKMPPSAATRR